MDIRGLAIRSSVLKDRVNKYAILGLGISIASIIIASLLVSYQLTGFIDFHGVIVAQKTNPALWALDLTPLLFAYWGQSFCYELANTMESMLEDKTRELVNKSSDLELKLQHEAHHDHLTNLPNQRLLTQRIEQGIRQINKGEELAIILLHINDFKDINYKFGSFNANNLLIQFAERLKTILLQPYLLQAYMGMNMASRIQGAEFAILIPRLRKDHHFEDLLGKLLAETSANFMIDGNSINITTTAGIALYPQHGDNDATLMRHASYSLFYAEEKGLPFAIYQTSMDKSAKANHVKVKELSEAIDKEAIGISYFPEYELKTGKIIGAEAVVFFDSAQYGMMTGEQLLPLFESTVLAQKLTNLMLKSAIHQLSKWHQAQQKIYLTVNLFDVTDMELPSVIGGLLKENNLSPEYLKIAITEKTCLSDQSRSLNILKQLESLGIKIVISDFCSGYTSFLYLTNFPINEIKIDKSFVMSMMKDDKKLKIVRAVQKLADAMQIVVAADGIPDEKTMKELKKEGYLYGQAPYLSPAVDAESFTALLNKS